MRGGTETYVNSIKKALEGRGFVVDRLTIDVRDFSKFTSSRFPKWYKFRDGLFYKKNVGQAIEQKIREFQPDLIHINNNAYFTSTILQVANRLNIPALQTIHDYRLIPKAGENAFITWVKKIRLGIVKKRTTHFIAPSYKFEKTLETHGVKNAIYIPHYIELDQWETDQEHIREKRILYIGRLEIEKGIYVLFDAWRKIAHEFPDYQLLFIGEGSESKNLAKAIQDHQLDKQTELHPFKPQAVIKEHLYTSELIVVPSAYREMFGLIGLEAFACDIPVIASDVAGIPEWCIHEKTGLLTPMEDVPALAKAMKKLLNNPAFAKKLAENAHQFLHESHDKEKSIDILEQLYRQLN